MNFIGVEMVLNPYDTNRYWMYIEGFNGYEISNDGYVRSMKHYKKYPCGILLRPLTNDTDPVFELSNDNNKRCKMRRSELFELVKNNNAALGYPRATLVTNISARNKFIKNDDGAYVKVYNGPNVRKKNKSNIDLDANVGFPKFTITPD